MRFFESAVVAAATPNTLFNERTHARPRGAVAENCGDYAFSTRAGGAWAHALGHASGSTVSPDGGTIGGTTSTTPAH
jgi:hypothetical protein